MALLQYPHIFSTSGEWIGWVSPQREVYDVDGVYAGLLTNDARITRQRSKEGERQRLAPPPAPQPIRPPTLVPLAPMMAELPGGTIDVLQEEPERLHPIDTGELKADME
jgi:hypothetical protein